MRARPLSSKPPFDAKLRQSRRTQAHGPNGPLSEKSQSSTRRNWRGKWICSSSLVGRVGWGQRRAQLALRLSFQIRPAAEPPHPPRRQVGYLTVPRWKRICSSWLFSSVAESYPPERRPSSRAINSVTERSSLCRRMGECFSTATMPVPRCSDTGTSSRRCQRQPARCWRSIRAPMRPPSRRKLKTKHGSAAPASPPLLHPCCLRALCSTRGRERGGHHRLSRLGHPRQPRSSRSLSLTFTCLPSSLQGDLVRTTTRVRARACLG